MEPFRGTNRRGEGRLWKREPLRSNGRARTRTEFIRPGLDTSPVVEWRRGGDVHDHGQGLPRIRVPVDAADRAGRRTALPEKRRERPVLTAGNVSEQRPFKLDSNRVLVVSVERFGNESERVSRPESRQHPGTIVISEPGHGKIRETECRSGPPGSTRQDRQRRDREPREKPASRCRVTRETEELPQEGENRHADLRNAGQTDPLKAR